MTLSILMLDKCRFASDCYAECCGRHYLTISISSPAISSARGKYHCTVDLLFERFGISCMATDNFLFLFAKQTNPKDFVKHFYPELTIEKARQLLQDILKVVIYKGNR